MSQAVRLISAIAFAFTFAIATSTSVHAAGADSHKILSRLVGVWHNESVVHRSNSTEVEIRRSGTTRVEWFLDESFVRNEPREGTDSNPANNFKGNALNMFGYDASREVFRQWYFDSNGGSGDCDGVYDDESDTLTFTGNLPGDSSVVNKIKFIDANTQFWTSILRNNAGEVLSNVEITLKRKQ